MTDIEKKWFIDTEFKDLGASLSSNSLGLDSFWGLFTIAGSVALSALFISLGIFLNEHREVWFDSSVSVWTRIRTLMRIYDQRNLSSHTFRNVGTSSNTTPYPQSPKHYWNSSERGFDNSARQSTPMSEIMHRNLSRPEELV